MFFFSSTRCGRHQESLVRSFKEGGVQKRKRRKEKIRSKKTQVFFLLFKKKGHANTVITGPIAGGTSSSWPLRRIVTRDDCPRIGPGLSLLFERIRFNEIPPAGGERYLSLFRVPVTFRRHTRVAPRHSNPLPQPLQIVINPLIQAPGIFYSRTLLLFQPLRPVSRRACLVELMCADNCL